MWRDCDNDPKVPRRAAASPNLTSKATISHTDERQHITGRSRSPRAGIMQYSTWAALRRACWQGENRYVLRGACGPVDDGVCEP